MLKSGKLCDLCCRGVIFAYISCMLNDVMHLMSVLTRTRTQLH